MFMNLSRWGESDLRGNLTNPLCLPLLTWGASTEEDSGQRGPLTWAWWGEGAETNSGRAAGPLPVSLCGEYSWFAS